MTDESFEVLSRQEDVPFRLKNNFAGYDCLRGEQGHVLIRGGLMPELQAAAQRAVPLETGGLLIGRIFRDDTGRYATVVGFVEAPAGTGTSGHINMPSELIAQLRVQAAREHPTSDVIGWWHSHMVESQYSQTDRRTQSIWTDPQNVGILVFSNPRGRNFGTVYQGPEGLTCQLEGKIAGAEPAAVPPAAGEEPFHRQQPPPRVPMLEYDTPSNGSRHRVAASDRQPDNAARLLIVVVVLVALTMVIVILMLGSLTRQVDQRVPQWQNADAATWFCVSQGPTKPSRYLCTATVRSPGTIHWINAGREMATGPQTTVTVTPGSPVTLMVVVSDSTGDHDLGSQVLNYASAPATPATTWTSDTGIR